MRPARDSSDQPQGEIGVHLSSPGITSAALKVLESDLTLSLDQPLGSTLFWRSSLFLAGEIGGFGNAQSYTLIVALLGANECIAGGEAPVRPSASDLEFFCLADAGHARRAAYGRSFWPSRSLPAAFSIGLSAAAAELQKTIRMIDNEATLALRRASTKGGDQ